MEHEHALPVGTLLADEYRIDGILGAGGFGITYRARDVKLDIDVAIKEYFPRDFASRSNTVTVQPRGRSEVDQFKWGLSQFIDEARRLARLQHPNIVRCMRYFEAHQTGYFVMTFEEGRTLENYFPRPPQQREIDTLLEPLLNALEALHAAGIYHRDISPDNILIRDDGSPVLIDFGASRQALARRTQTVAAIVKPGYSPIEQYDTETSQQGAWSDIYALGATLYSVISGGPPPDALSRVRKDTYVPASQSARGAYRAEFLAAIDWALETDSEHRPVTIREWRRKLIGSPSGRSPKATAATRYQPADDLKTKVTRFIGLDGNKSPAGNKSGDLRWPDYVLRGSALVMLAVFLIRTFAGDENPSTTTTTTTTAYQTPAPAQQQGGAPSYDTTEERRLPMLVNTTTSEATWKRVELVLRRLGHLSARGTATISDIREALKAYQGAIGEHKTGVLNQSTINRVLDEAIELDPYTLPGAAAHGRWFFAKDQERCHIATGATRIEGRVLVTERPVIEFYRKRNTENVDEIDIFMAKGSMFDTAAPISMTAGGVHQLLFVDQDNISMGKNPDDSWSREVTRTLRRHPGEVQMTGTSAYGGALRLTFSTDGFEPAFRAMAAECGPGITYWIDDWGAVARDSNGTVWHSVLHGDEQRAKDAAMNECTSRSQAGNCEQWALFHDQCWAVATGMRRSKDDWGSGWGADTTLESAKALSLDYCAKDGGKNCTLVMTICADGSNEWEPANE
jgi:serine/threonine protein kinase